MYVDIEILAHRDGINLSKFKPNAATNNLLMFILAWERVVDYT